MSDEYEQITETLSQLSEDWKVREECLKRLGRYVEENKADIFVFLNQRGAKIFALQLTDLRSSVVKAVSETFHSICEAKLCNKSLNLHDFADNFLREPNLYKAIGSGNKLIYKYASCCLVELFEIGTILPVSLESFFNYGKGNKNPQIREKIAQCLAIYSNQTWRKGDTSDFFRRAAECFLKDANMAVRGQAKKIRILNVDTHENIFIHDNINQSKDTADEAEPSLSRKVRLRPNLKILNDKKVFTEQNIKIPFELIKNKKNKKVSIHDFKNLLFRFLNSTNDNSRLEVFYTIQKTELNHLMPELLDVAFELDIASNIILSPLLPLMASWESTSDFLNFFLRKKNKESLVFLKEKLGAKLENIPLEQSFIERLSDGLCNVLVSKESSEGIKKSCAEILVLLVSNSVFISWVERHFQIFYGASLVAEQLDSKNLSALRELNIFLKEKAKTNQTKQNFEYIYKSQNIPSTNSSEPSLMAFYQLFRSAGKEERDKLGVAVVELGDWKIFYQFVIELINNTEASAIDIVDVLKWMISALKALKDKTQTTFFLIETMNRLDNFIQTIKDRIFSHSEVIVRKTVVHLLVCFYHLIGEENFLRVLNFFSPEQQRLIQVYVKKSLE